MGKVTVLSGNEACVEGALAAGVRFFAGYPITPSSSIAEMMSKRLPELGGKFIQMEDEIASMNTIIGASLAGVKVLGATSGPGFSLKQESFGVAMLMEVPCVVVDVQRVGPSTGMATMPAQGDIMASRWGTHGDHPVIVLAPSNVRECFDLTAKAVNFAERFRTLVFVLTDAILASLLEKVEVPDSVETIDRLRPTVPPGQYLPYAAGEDGVPAMADFGSGYHWYASSNMHDERGFLATDQHDVAWTLINRLHNKILWHKKDITFYSTEWLDDAEVVVFSYGSTARSARAAVKMAREKGIKAGFVKTLTIWPFPDELISQIAEKAKAIVVPEMNMGQLVEKVREVACGRTRVVSVAYMDGKLIPPGQILEGIGEAVNG
jgi:2-oxoglutarate ferredoxin oxidoreductase subunit alpha